MASEEIGKKEETALTQMSECFTDLESQATSGGITDITKAKLMPFPIIESKFENNPRDEMLEVKRSSVEENNFGLFKRMSYSSNTRSSGLYQPLLAEHPENENGSNPIKRSANSFHNRKESFSRRASGNHKRTSNGGDKAPPLTEVQPFIQNREFCGLDMESRLMLFAVVLILVFTSAICFLMD